MYGGGEVFTSGTPEWSTLDESCSREELRSPESVVFELLTLSRGLIARNPESTAPEDVDVWPAPETAALGPMFFGESGFTILAVVGNIGAGSLFCSTGDDGIDITLLLEAVSTVLLLGEIEDTILVGEREMCRSDTGLQGLEARLSRICVMSNVSPLTTRGVESRGEEG